MGFHAEIVTALQQASARAGRDTFSCPQAFWDAARKALAAADYALFASMQETQGIVDLLLIQAHADMLPLTVLTSVGSLVKAAHWYRAAGDSERAAQVGRRAWIELEALLGKEAAGTFGLPESNLHWYVVEMAGDAAACFDADMAARLYAEAEAGFSHMDHNEQRANDAEIFPGMEYIGQLMDPHLYASCPPRGLSEHGVDRIRFKRKEWLRR
jgi:hypothetical protein